MKPFAIIAPPDLAVGATYCAAPKKSAPEYSREVASLEAAAADSSLPFMEITRLRWKPRKVRRSYQIIGGGRW